MPLRANRLFAPSETPNAPSFLILFKFI